MLNIDGFLNRLEELMETHQLNAATFAKKIDVQRSSVSHILSRRNKPSLDFILKIQSQFEDVDFEWLLLGIPLSKIPPNPKFIDHDSEKSDTNTIKSQSHENDLEVTQIIQTYKDGSFRIFLPKT
jgi:transcriptional regulator with XRE-family HTH domain